MQMKVGEQGEGDSHSGKVNIPSPVLFILLQLLLVSEDSHVIYSLMHLQPKYVLVLRT